MCRGFVVKVPAGAQTCSCASGLICLTGRQRNNSGLLLLCMNNTVGNVVADLIESLARG